MTHRPLDGPRLNLACGEDVRPGWVNVDLYDGEGVDAVFDATADRWPFDDRTFVQVYAGCVLPHIPKGFENNNHRTDPLLHLVDEAWRVLKVGGRFVVTCPDVKYRPDLGLSGWDHYRVITPQTFNPYYADHDPRGLGNPPRGPFRLERDERGWQFHTKGRDGRPLGVSRIAPEWWPVGQYRLGLLTHLWRRLGLRVLLRGNERKMTFVKEVRSS